MIAAMDNTGNGRRRRVGPRRVRVLRRARRIARFRDSLVELGPKSRQITLSDGRLLGFDDFGDPEGTPVLFFHGFGSSRVVRHPDDEHRDRAGSSRHRRRPTGDRHLHAPAGPSRHRFPARYRRAAGHPRHRALCRRGLVGRRALCARVRLADARSLLGRGTHQRTGATLRGAWLHGLHLAPPSCHVADGRPRTVGHRPGHVAMVAAAAVGPEQAARRSHRRHGRGGPRDPGRSSLARGDDRQRRRDVSAGDRWRI